MKDKSLRYLTAVKRCLPKSYFWMYTNGILVEKDILKKMADAGLDELRFDISAVNYSLEKVRLASDYIPNVTIEIPAIPEDEKKVKAMLFDFVKAGTKYLNLHQMRCTSFNFRNLASRGYTILHGEKPTVLESELMALRILDYAEKEQIDLGINYCNYQYRNRFQKSGFRRKLAANNSGVPVSVTKNGYLRISDGQYVEDNNFCSTQENYSYAGVLIEDAVKHDHNSNFNIGKKAYRWNYGEVMNFKKLSNIQQGDWQKVIKTQGKELPNDEVLFRLWQYEFIEWELRPYF
ncbi:MAG: hypothetical protein C0594_08295 [Marinilabiliales bacterium]|nr:MAG: hypothetical protein C0594_08295 [Marinilabiliales bacterium]